MSSSNPILILGTGAMGCLFAARLSAAGVPVTVSGTWAEGLAALRQHGVRLVEASGQERAYPVQVAENLGSAIEARFALVLVKSWQTERAAHQLSGCLPEDGLALTLQNGTGNREVLSQVLGAQRVAAGITTLGANLVGPGYVRAAGEGTITLSAHARIDPLAALLRAVGFSVETVADLTALLWGKLVINAAINPITALLGIPNGELLVRKAAHTLMASAAREAAGIAAAHGVRLPYPDPVARVEAVARQTAANRSSMLQDVQRGAPTEIDAICGAIVQAGEQAGLPAPINKTLWLLVSALSERIS